MRAARGVTFLPPGSLQVSLLTIFFRHKMRYSLLASASVILAISACQESAAPEPPPTFRLTATVTDANTCSVTTMEKSFSSIGQIRGDVPTKFIGTVAEKSYHGMGCWVATEGGDGDLIVLFSGNNFGKPLAVGTYPLRREVLDDTPLGFASVTFRSSQLLGGDKMRTMDNAVGSVVVEATPSGGRLIRVDVEVVRWGSTF